MSCCIGGICIPYTALLPIVLIIVKPILEFLGLYKYVEQFQGRKAKKCASSEETKEGSCCDIEPIGETASFLFTS